MELRPRAQQDPVGWMWVRTQPGCRQCDIPHPSKGHPHAAPQNILYFNLARNPKNRTVRGSTRTASVTVRCCFSGKDACVSLLTGRKHSAVAEREGLALIGLAGKAGSCRAANKMRLHSPFVQSSLLATMKLSANPEREPCFCSSSSALSQQ
ncbi:hypothetical protein KUCAC02_005945 [Chaenocephalus aceratus]|uniref:Uncharacterized protein n=1 Tax=Chaenocephalus aceratus TaxID=36190 RepID=A0ACB9WQ22_CHAAC|nr:hypothetical protein KUCAC02_005945 [Chaenocephalus aceratus]